MDFDPTNLIRLGTARRRREAATEKERPELEKEIQTAAASGMPQHQIVEITGYSRENVRLLCMTPEQREAERAKRRKKPAKPERGIPAK